MNSLADTTSHPGEAVVIGAGPAGLAAAWEWVSQGAKPKVFEKGSIVGGIARTEIYKGYRFDVGGHRFYSKLPAVEKLWQEMLGDDLLKVSRLSRIYFRGRYFPYPLQIFATLRNLGPVDSIAILLSYLRWQIAPYRQENSFEEYVTNRFGKRLYETFFRSYTEKVWGMPCREISADWAAQRIQGLSFTSVLKGALSGGSRLRSLTTDFLYPRHGPGMMWKRFAERIDAAGGRVETETEVVKIHHHENRVTEIELSTIQGSKTIAVADCVSSLPLPHLIERLHPTAPEEVLAAARSLRFRDFVMVGLVVTRPDLFPDQWIYIHAPEFQVGRVQNFGNWSPDLVPDASTSSLGMEYFCTQSDALWQLPDQEIVELASTEAVGLGLVKQTEIIDATVIRQPKAYPVYDQEYRTHVGVIRHYLDRFSNLSTVGRNGLHRYNNQDHSMLSGQRAVKNRFGETNDIWTAKAEEDYLEVGINRE